MNILIDIAHPAHVHLLRNTYFNLLNKNHKIWVTVKNIPSAMQLLDIYGIPYIKIGEKKDSLWQKGIDQVLYNIKLWILCIRHHIDIGLGSSITIAHVSKLCRMKSIILDDDDDEVEPLFAKYAHPFADVVLSPVAVKEHRKTSHAIFYAGYHELAYLHPSRFTPDSDVLNEVGLKEGEQFFIMRFNVFKAHHDVGVVGLSLEQKVRLINLLKQHGKVFITTEREPEPELLQYHMPVSPEKAHDLMAFATMFLGDSQTMTSEAAVLGVPALRCNSFVGRIAYLEEEEHKYGLTYGFKPDDFERMYQKVEELLNTPHLKETWQVKRQKMLADKIDTTDFITSFVENYK